MSRISLSTSSKQVFADFSKTQHVSKSFTQSAFCLKVQQIWNRICSLLSSLLCCKCGSRSKTPLIASSQSSEKKPQEIKPLPRDPRKPQLGQPSASDSQKPDDKPTPPSSRSDGVNRLPQLPAAVATHSLGIFRF